ncbi:trypsin-like serine protease [Streptomyces sp. NBC_01619]|uniref:Trypsin-like serine protease n=1 Tax=Streptomyces pratisoli TaxID=3139917 RepID=A0ACC6QN29_9ACTN|nr:MULTISPECIES: trypsin-like serine protease [unclassified Streptomyces]MCX4513304.1 trypsin-like serine protease [Streptomyces sp. NBC_01619]
MTLALPAVAAVVALAGAGFAFTGSDSAEAGEAPTISVESQKPAEPSKKELRSRVAQAMKADASSKRTLVKQPQADAAKTAPGARIIGGAETTISQAPWMAQLYFSDSTGAGYFCGGAVIAPTKVLTAAHCVKGIKWYETGTVVVGTDHVPTVNSDGSVNLHGGAERGAYRQWNHPQYSPYTIDNDVAVLTLTSPVPSTVKPLPLAQPTDSALYAAGLDGKVYGWGRTSSTEPNSASDVLKVADADMVSDTDCAAAYPAPTETAAKFINGHMVCAGAAPTGEDATTETTCNGDSGGPLVVGGKLVGVVSWGDVDCSAAGKYGVYAKVSTYSAPVQARVDDANWNYDHTADVLARRTSDNTLFAWTSKVSSYARTENLGNFAGYNLAVQADLDRDDWQDLVARASNGYVYWDHFVPATEQWERKLLSTGWAKNKQLLIPGDLTGDELPDLLTVNSTGYLILYPGKGNGGFAAPVQAGGGWGQYGVVRGHGDFTNDGKPDILARGSDGSTYLYRGTGKVATPFEARRLVGKFTLSSFTALVTVGDVNSDGHADLLVRDSTGKLWLYPGNGNSAATGGIFATRKDFGVGWQAYNLFG